MWILITQKIFFEWIFDIFRFPFWWYKDASRSFLMKLGDFFVNINEIMAPGLWLKNITVPMFGQNDIQGRLVSFFMRFMNVIIRSFAMFFVVVIVIILFILWLLLPLFVLYMLYVSIVS